MVLVPYWPSAQGLCQFSVEIPVRSRADYARVAGLQLTHRPWPRMRRVPYIAASSHLPGGRHQHLTVPALHRDARAASEGSNRDGDGVVPLVLVLIKVGNRTGVILHKLKLVPLVDHWGPCTAQTRTRFNCSSRLYGSCSCRLASSISKGVKGENDRLLRVHQYLGARPRIVVRAYQVASNTRPPLLLSH